MELGQQSLTGGEISPSLFGRVDLARYQTALRALENMFVRPTGGVSNRAGTEFIDNAASNTAQASILIPFVVSNDQAYVLEFSQSYIRAYFDGALINSAGSTSTITSITFSYLTVGSTIYIRATITTSSAHGLSAADSIFMSEVVTTGGYNVNGIHSVDDVTSATVFRVRMGYSDTLPTYVSGGEVYKFVPITTSYSDQELRALRYTQSADVMTITSPDHFPSELSRLSANSFSFAEADIDDGPFKDANTDKTKFIHASGVYGVVTLTSTSSLFTTSLIGSLLKLTEIDLSYISPWSAGLALAGTSASIHGLLRRSDGKVYRAVNSGTTGSDPSATWYTGTIAPVHTEGVAWDGAFNVVDKNNVGVEWEYLHSGYGIVRITGVTSGTSATAVVIKRLPESVVGGAATGHGPWTMTGNGSTKTLAAAGATSFNRYDYEVTFDGVIKESTLIEADASVPLITFFDAPANGVAVSVRQLSSNNRTHDWALGAWSEQEGYPSSVTYYKDRIVYASSRSSPQTEWASRVGKYHEFLPSTPIVDSDPLTQTLNARQVNDIRELIPLDQLIAITATSSVASPQRGSAWTPSTIGFDPQTNVGCASVRSVIINDSAVFAETYGTRLRDLRYTFQADKFGSNELTLFARHLFSSDKTIVDIAYQGVPYNLIWVLRSDGTLCSCTYLPDQEVIGWARHPIDGQVESLCTIPENGLDTLYMIVRRNINGADARFIERMKQRDLPDRRDLFFVDCGLTYDGRNTSSYTMTLSGSTWNLDDLVSVTASATLFASTDAGDQIHFPYIDDEGVSRTLRVELVTYSSATVFTGKLLADAPVQLQATSTMDWGFARNTFSGLDHLQNTKAFIQADGAVEEPQTVTNSQVTISSPAVVVHIGIGYESLLKTLDVNVQGQNIRTYAKNVPGVSIMIEDSSYFLAGPDENHLDPYRPRTTENYGNPPDLVTEMSEPIYIATNWNRSGGIVIKQDQPAPLTVLSIHPKVEFGSSG